MRNRKITGYWVASLIFFAIGCSENLDDTQAEKLEFSAFAAPSQARAQVETNTMARSHQVTIEVIEKDLEKGFRATTTACNEISTCELLDSSLNSGDYPQANVRLRLLPESVSKLIDTAASFGELTRLESNAEDLAKPMFDQAERLSMLRQYMADLKALRIKAKDEVDALIRLASEISRTQSQIESAEGQRAHLQQRVDTEIISFQFVIDAQQDIWSPIGDSLENFGYELSEGIGSAIIGIAYILPWLFVLIPLFFLLRWLWRKTRGV